MIIRVLGYLILCTDRPVYFGCIDVLVLSRNWTGSLARPVSTNMWVVFVGVYICRCVLKTNVGRTT